MIRNRPTRTARAPAVNLMGDARFADEQLMGSADFSVIISEYSSRSLADLAMVHSPGSGRLFIGVLAVMAREIEPFQSYTNCIGKCQWTDMITHKRVTCVKLRLSHVFAQIDEVGLHAFKVWRGVDGIELERFNNEQEQ
jgi:hypothetical protein